ncbi:hydrophobin 2 [Histoplasma capsulatum G186AR]|uniref:Hydrophobin n=2 Tax=Ajellomyces capsulatus TaxID=5037 RepID=C0NTU2_AJECG|nr:hydrophobin 2 [Histoplasma capsulatum G186AR]EEH05453.1 hydrophobin 2 [Histoplasma capsulatum G186AR]KAG5305178.1 hydrophobin 2 [Histoplasma capsulatum]QSS76138.1 hydrophobin 2 [Histoplasma capsulatum G186AR]
MKFSISAVVLALAAVAVAAPGGEYRSPKGDGDVEVNQVTNQCGKAQISCCNKKITTVNGGDKNTGLLAGVLGTVVGKGSDIGIFDQCSKLSASALIGVTDILSGNQCKQNVACCQGNSQHAEGFIALNLPCIPISGF